MDDQKADWLYEITPKGKLLSLNLAEIWRYKDLLQIFVRRDFVAQYKQTVLGPLWFLIQPLFTSVVFTLIFNNVAGIDTGAVPPFLFNLAGITLWNYFKDCLTTTTGTFTGNAGIFSKVYFPRVIVPLSKVISNLVKFGVQVLIFIVFYIIYLFKGFELGISGMLWIFPLLVFIIAGLGLGLGLLFTSITTKYRDLNILIGFGVQLLLYISAVMYPLSMVQERLPNYAWLVIYNPIAQIVEAFRYITLGVGTFSWISILLSFLLVVFLLVFGLLVFNRTERSFIDTV